MKYVLIGGAVGVAALGAAFFAITNSTWFQLIALGAK
jgi:hypothetical protein